MKLLPCNLWSEENRSYYDYYDTDFDVKNELCQLNSTPIHFIHSHKYQQEEQQVHSILSEAKPWPRNFTTDYRSPYLPPFFLWLNSFEHSNCLFTVLTKTLKGIIFLCSFLSARLSPLKLANQNIASQNYFSQIQARKTGPILPDWLLRLTRRTRVCFQGKQVSVL